MIRRIAPDDLPQVLQLCRELHERSRYARFKPHWPTVTQTLIRCSASPVARVFVAVHDDKITGLLVAVAEEYFWAEPKMGPRYVSDLFLFSKRAGDAKRLLDAMVAWAWTVPRVVRVEMGVSSGVEGADRVHETMFARMGTMYEVENPKLTQEAAA